MEDTLRVGNGQQRYEYQESLNPCFNGRYSQRSLNQTDVLPCSVLILVLMEDTLRGSTRQQFVLLYQVLILVLMEDTLREKLLG